ncbi:MAG: response regulator [Candidatus Omnitrophica bacterium]|nr:response regulator [Candidatus Omnitrophota bacterium]
MLKKILIVDDTEVNRELLKETLRTAQGSYQITEAADGKTALEMIARERPDIVLLDVQMPDMDGFEVCQRMKMDSETQAIPVILITAFTSIEDKVKGFSVGAVDFVTKPITPEEVVARVKAHLKTKDAENARLEVDRLRTLKNIVVTYNHNMNQPLMVVYTCLTILENKLKNDPVSLGKVKSIKTELDKIKEILKQIKMLGSVKEAEYVGDTGMIEINR